MAEGSRNRAAQKSVFSVKPKAGAESSAKKFVSIIKPSSHALIVETQGRKSERRRGYVKG